MDPVLEVATVTVEYLWAWREIFPEHVEFPGEAPITAEAIQNQVGGDVGMYVRLRELSARSGDEGWPGSAEQGSRGHVATDIEDVAEEIARERSRSDQTGWLQKATASVSEFLFSAATRGDQDQVLRRMVEGYAAHLAELAAVLGPIPLRGERDLRTGVNGSARSTVTRESLTQHLARVMLDERTVMKVAAALDYRPLLFRELRLPPELLDRPGYPNAVIEAARESEALPFALVHHEELSEIERSRLRRAAVAREAVTGGSGPNGEAAIASDRADRLKLFGLCFSGGGIRSATFNLGVLQALASRGWLSRVDYLSTVSGGGYIGAWLISWIKRRGSVALVEESLRASFATCGAASSNPDGFQNTDPAAEHVRPIRFLREHSNYLAPSAGFFSTDTWTMISIWIRNTVLNLLVLALFLMGLLVAPRAVGFAFVNLRSPALATASAVVLLFAATWLIGRNLRTFNERSRPTGRIATRGDSAFVITTTLVLPLFAAALLSTAAFWSAPESAGFGFAGDPFFLIPFFACFAGIVAATAVGNYRLRGGHGVRALELDKDELAVIALRAVGRALLPGAAAALVGGVLARVLARSVVPLLWEDTQRGVWIAVAFGPLVVLFVLSAVIVLYLGLEGQRFPDERREWWSRLGALIGLMGAAWALVASISFFAPRWVAQLGLYAGAAGGGWAAVTALGAWLASSGESNGRNLPLDKKLVTATLIKMAPFVFVLGFLVLLSIGAHVLLGLLQYQGVLVSSDFSIFEVLPFQLGRYVETYWASLEPRSPAPPLTAIALCLLAGALARRVDVNEFSMHHFYRNRLVRAFLGASRSRQHRWPNAFTGFDLDDDIKLWRFTTSDVSVFNDASSDCRPGYTGPFPIINATLNVTAGDDLAWQERKGQSFVFTPLYCGYDFSAKHAAVPERVATQFGFRPTKQYGNGAVVPTAAAITHTLRAGTRDLIDRSGGLEIGTAVAISGAAANPNAGYHSSPGVAFLLTVFNARLGWWMGNPRLDHWMRSSPRQGLFYLLSELLGFASTRRKYVNLSDGGHFDNMGLYELVRRRCRYIVVCDAEQDYTYSSQGLASAIRKCRVDFGVVITMTTELPKPDPDTGLAKWHYAVGRIAYPGAQGYGRLVYLKSSVTGDEPTDVLEYRHRFKEFPHQSTSDQFFDESQFESYRALGLHVGEEVFARSDTGAASGDVEGLFAAIVDAAGKQGRKESTGEDAGA